MVDMDSNKTKNTNKSDIKSPKAANHPGRHFGQSHGVFFLAITTA
jgi:hypothetical protein